ncbi:EamA family transporter [Heliobacterium chlorum]|uniref:EamA family transporter n=1 Tax=Heliobacterium chlorum TaxID=2698 RepID=A0ABR7T6H4_HELCL|nr:EamA family transporter [Heliobacterium chlorum]MBC9786379.1 EamA family transporter [Heliobacterium chlorum]
MGSLLVLLSALAFGSMAVMAAAAYGQGVNVTTLLALRFAIAAAILWAIVSLRKEKVSIRRRTWMYLFLLGAVCYGGQSFCFFTAVEKLNPALAAMLLYTYPVIVYIVSLLLGKEKVHWTNLLALAAASAGILLVLGASLDMARLDLSGIFFGLGAAVIFSVYLLLSDRVVKEVPPLVMTTYISSFAAMTFALSGLILGELHFSLTGQAYGAIFAIALVCTVVAILALSAGIERIGPAKASILSTIEPAWTVFLSFIVFGETLNGSQLLGGVLILCSVLLLQLKNKPDKTNR